jgi:prepilin-type N-terminal cleavage/methylation domain-containing protein
MKIPAYHLKNGFTLIELSVGISIFALLLIGVLSLHITCMKLCSFESKRFTSVSQAMHASSQILMEMRSAYSNSVGTLTTPGSPSSFSAATNGFDQVGDVLQIVPPLNGPLICYYYASNTLYRSQGNGSPTIVASSITNSDNIFHEETAAGVVRTNRVATSITSITLQFFTTNAATISYFRNPTNYLSFQTKAYPRNF